MCLSFTFDVTGTKINIYTIRRKIDVIYEKKIII